MGRLLESQGFWFFDIGPFWRSLSQTHSPKTKPEDYIAQMRKLTDDPEWEHNFLAKTLESDYRSDNREKTDLVISGFRSLDDIRKIQHKLEGIISPDQKHSVIYLDCPFDIAWARYQQRDGASASHQKFLDQYDYEATWGIDEVRRSADFVIDNSGRASDLVDTIDRIVYGELHYPRRENGYFETGPGAKEIF